MGKKNKKDRLANYSDGMAQVTVIGEESGGWSKKPYGPKSMTLALSETDRRYEFGRISEYYPNNTRGTHNDKELKWRSSSDRTRKRVLRDVNELRPKIVIITDERETTLENTERYQELFRDAVDEMMLITDADLIDMIMDDSPLMKPSVGEYIAVNAAKERGKIIRYRQVDSEDFPEVQTQDIIAGAANKMRIVRDERFIGKIREHIVSWIIKR